MQVVHVVLSLDLGGLERVVVALAREGVRHSQRITVICLERPGILAARVEELGAAVICMHKRPGLRPGLIRRLQSIFREVQPDVVHTHQVGALFYAGPAAQRAGVRAIVHTEHGKHYAVRRRTRWLGWWAGRYVGRFCCVSQDIANEVTYCRIVPQSKIKIVANGIDTAAFNSNAEPNALRRSLAIPENAPLIGTVGRLHEIKRQDLLVRALSHLPDAHLLLVGDGPMLGPLRQLTEELHVDSRVHFAGYQAHPEAYLRAMDVFALTSRSEGMPLAILEAWAAGLPVVASRVGGLPDLIEEGQTGFLFACGDESSLTEALCCLLADRELRKRMGAAGREQVRQRYDVARMAGEYERHYRELKNSSRTKTGSILAAKGSSVLASSSYCANGD